MTTRETDRPTDPDAVEENDEMRGSDDLTAEPVDLEHEPEATPSGEQDAVDDELPESGETEPGVVDPDEAAIEREPVGDPVGTDVVEDQTAGESGSVQKLAPVGPDRALDPGTGSYEDRWGAIQAGFIDEPRRTVESASVLVAEIWDDTVRALTDEREAVDGRWQSTESSTDDLREAMQDYRSLYARYTSFTSS